jgi:cysteine-rich repeat protein
VCGDGTVYVGVEQCDDNNMIDTDECTNACTAAVCGDGIIWEGMETCEDLNNVDSDACTNACQDAACGDGILWEGMEICDDNNMNDNDACPGSCEPAFCGDGYTQIGVEECDDGNQNNNDFCFNDCTSDGYFDNFETNNLMLLPWMLSGNGNWATSNVQPHQGSYVAASGTITHNQTSTIQVTLNVPANGIVRFWHRVSSEGSWDYLRFYIDNVQQGNGWSGNLGWQQVQYNVTQGQHVFRWTYSKDGSVNSFEDKVYIDEVYVGL